MRKPINHEKRKLEVIEACSECFCRMGLGNVGIRQLAEESGMSPGNIYHYFDSVDELVLQATDYSIAKVEKEFMAKVPTDPGDLERFLDEAPYWTAREHGAKYRLMYQVYTHPKYIEHGREFLKGLNARYAAELEPKLGIPQEVLTPLIFTFVRAAVHYAMFEDKRSLKSQVDLLKQTIALFRERENAKGVPLCVSYDTAIANKTFLKTARPEAGPRNFENEALERCLLEE